MIYYTNKTKEQMLADIENRVYEQASVHASNIRNGSIDNLASNIEFLVARCVNVAFQEMFDNLKHESEIDNVLLGSKDGTNN